MEDITNYDFGASYGSCPMYGSSPTTPNANIGQPEAASTNIAHPQDSNCQAVEANQTEEPALEAEAAAAVTDYNGQYVDIHNLNNMISAKTLEIRREEEEVEKLEEVVHQLLQRKQQHSQEQWQQRQLRLSQSKIMNEILSLTEVGIIDGFVYGIVPKGKDPVSAASENLRGWWKDEANFDRDGRMAIFRYNTSSSPITNNIDHRSLMEIHDTTLESLVSALMQHCDPPQRCYPFDKGVAPPWWPSTRNEEWWGQMTLPDDLSVPPYKKPHCLQKRWKMSVLVAMVKHLIPHNHKLIIRVVRESNSLQRKMPAKDSMIWSAYVEHERRIYLELNPFTDIFSSEHGSNAQQIPSGGCSSSMDCGKVDLGYNEEAQQASMPAFLLHQSPQVSAQEAARNELYNIKGKAVISDDPTLYRPRRQTGLFIK